jgi:hypothetical protein
MTSGRSGLFRLDASQQSAIIDKYQFIAPSGRNDAPKRRIQMAPAALLSGSTRANNAKIATFSGLNTGLSLT